MTLASHPPPQAPAGRQRRSALRLAAQIHAQLSRSPSYGDLLYHLEHLDRELQQVALLRRQLRYAQHKAWHLASQRLLTDLEQLLGRLPSQVQAATQSLPRTPLLQSPAQICQELEMLEEEFGAWHHEEGILRVTTAPITLDEIPLGRFEIRLDLERLAVHHMPYQVVALHPNPASSNSTVTHPHVRDETLCEGEAALPIRAALAQGRLGDFFVLVRSVLQTYNPQSPHVALSAWHGWPCHECGYVTDDGDGSNACDSCGHDVCESCWNYCRSCDSSYCLSCLDECPVCQERTCTSCLEACQKCHRPCCSHCLEDGLCPACMEAQRQQLPGGASAPADALPNYLQTCQHKEFNHDPSNILAAGLGSTEPIGDQVNPRHPCYPSLRARRRQRHRAA